MKRRFIQPAKNWFRQEVNRLGKVTVTIACLVGRQVTVTAEESALTKQIRENKKRIELFVLILDHMINHEHYPSHYSAARQIRAEMMFLAEENNILRRRLWQEWLEADGYERREGGRQSLRCALTQRSMHSDSHQR